MIIQVGIRNLEEKKNFMITNIDRYLLELYQ